MDWYAVNGGHTVNFTEVFPEDRNTGTTDTSDDPQCKSFPSPSQCMGGIIKEGKWAWLARKSCLSTLQIVSLRNGNTISKFNFDNMEYASKDTEYQIRFVEELFPGGMHGVVLAVCLENNHKSDIRKNEWYIALYLVQNNCVLRCIKIRKQITCLSFIEAKCCQNTFCQNFDGCLSVGTQEGKIIVIDLNIKRILLDNENQVRKEKPNQLTEAYITDYTDKLSDLFASFRKCRQENLHFGLQIEVITSPCPISSILPISFVFGLAVGFSDGRLALYDLSEFYCLVVLTPDRKKYASPVKRMNYLVAPDEARPCFYIFSLHENNKNLTTALHLISYKERLPDSDNESSYVFKNFYRGITRMRLVLEDTKSTIISCQSISTTAGENDINSLCVVGWYSAVEETNKLVIFDLNQWYKEGMPETVDCTTHITYFSGYILNGVCIGLDVQIKEDTIRPFNSMQRCEEHFYPSSLSFDCSALVDNSCRIYKWEGPQNRFINMLRSKNATIFLDPRPYHEEIVRTRLVPQFCEQDIESTFSKSAMYEIMLSVALENNCYSLLRDCARSWVDGSFICNLSLPTELSLSTLTNWIYKRATQIKERCNVLCGSVFENGNYPLDEREWKELSFITRQLRLLSNLLSDVLHFGKSNIPDLIFEKLSETATAINIATDYQEVLNWLLSIGLLPETLPSDNMDGSAVEDKSAQSSLYPFEKLSQFYANKRKFFGKPLNQLKMPNAGCRLLFIDALLIHYGLDDSLKEFWSETNGTYPPSSIESLLRVMLVPGVQFERKCAVLLYFLLDLNTLLDELTYKHVLENFIKFQSVFKLSASLVKMVEAFWSLDHGHLVMAVNQFLSSINNIQIFAKWQVELIVDALLAQNEAKLALRILQARPGAISPMLKLKTLLGSESVSEAFHFARNNENQSEESLLKMFFKWCIDASKFTVLQDLALTEKESQIAQRILLESKTPFAETLHFANLLQKSKYIEAVSYMDEIVRARDDAVTGGSGNSIVSNCVDQASNILAAYSTTMAPVTQNLTEIYFKIRNKIRLNEVNNATPEPFSAQLIKQNANTLLGGIYHSSALSAHFATYYWGNTDDPSQSTDLLSTKNAPFLRKPQNETNFSDLIEPRQACRPTPYQFTEKRPREKETENVGPLHKLTKSIEPPRKRRRVLGEDIVNDLSHFVTSNFGKSDENVLTQPLPRPLRYSRHEAVSLPGILKPPTPLPEFISCGDMGAKKLRFALPQVDANVESNINGKEANVLTEATNEDNNKPIDVFRSSFSQNVNLTSARFDECNLSKVSVTKRVSSVSLAQPTYNKDPLSLESGKSEALQKEVCDTNDLSPAQSPQQIEQHNSLGRSNQMDISETTVESNPDEIIVELLTEETEMSSVVRNDVSQTDSPRSSCYSSANDKYHSAITSTNVSQTTAVSSRYGLGPKPRQSLQDVRDNVDVAAAAAASIATLPNYESTSTGNAQISSAISSFALDSFNTMQGKTNDFAFAMCSSKVCETQSKFSHDYLQTKSSSNVKFSECTTIVGSLNSEMAASQIGPLERTQMPSAPSTDANKEPLQAQMLDTTLSMSTYDFTNIDSTAYIQPIQDECKSETPSVAESDQDESELNPDMVLNSNDCEESSIGPSVEESVESSTPCESDVIAMSTTTSPLHLDRSSIDDVIEINDQCSASNSDFAENRDPEELPPRSIYRVHSLETITEIETTKESSEEMRLLDDDCVVALDGTEVRGYMPRENKATPESDFKSVKAINTPVEIVTIETNAASPPRAQSTESIVQILYSDRSENESTVDFAWQDDLPSTSKGLATKYSAVMIEENQSRVRAQSDVAATMSVVSEESVENSSVPEKTFKVSETHQSEIQTMKLASGHESNRSERASSVPIYSTNKTNPQNQDRSQEGAMDGKMVRTTSMPCDFNKRSSAWPNVPKQFAIHFQRRLELKIKPVVPQTLVSLKKRESPLSDDIANSPATPRRYFLRRPSQELSDSTTVGHVTPRRRTQSRDSKADKKQVETEKSAPRSKRGSSVPVSRRPHSPQGLLKRNPMLDSICEDAELNRPLTRSRQRLCSITSDIDNSPAVDLTPKRNLRSRSVPIEPKSAKSLSRPSTPANTAKSTEEHSDDVKSNQDKPARRRLRLKSENEKSRRVSSSKLPTIDAKQEQEEDSKPSIVESTKDDTRPLKKRGRQSKK